MLIDILFSDIMANIYQNITNMFQSQIYIDFKYFSLNYSFYLVIPFLLFSLWCNINYHRKIKKYNKLGESYFNPTIFLFELVNHHYNVYVSMTNSLGTAKKGGNETGEGYKYNPYMCFFEIKKNFYDCFFLSNYIQMIHELGHSHQHYRFNLFYMIKITLDPFLSIFNNLGLLIMFWSFFTVDFVVFQIGSAFFVLTFLIKLLFLFVEFNANKRGYKLIKKMTERDKEEDCDNGLIEMENWSYFENLKGTPIYKDIEKGRKVIFLASALNYLGMVGPKQFKEIYMFMPNINKKEEKAPEEYEHFRKYIRKF